MPTDAQIVASLRAAAPALVADAKQAMDDLHASVEGLKATYPNDFEVSILDQNAISLHSALNNLVSGYISAGADDAQGGVQTASGGTNKN